MDPINPLQGLAELMRKRMGTDSAVGAGRPSGLRHDATVSDKKTSQPRNESLRGRVLEAVAGIKRDDPDRARKVRKLFIQNVLAWQFGDAILGDPGLAGLVEEVEEMMARNADVNQAFASLFSGEPKSRKGGES